MDVPFLCVGYRFFQLLGNDRFVSVCTEVDHPIDRDTSFELLHHLIQFFSNRSFLFFRLSSIQLTGEFLDLLTKQVWMFDILVHGTGKFGAEDQWPGPSAVFASRSQGIRPGMTVGLIVSTGDDRRHRVHSLEVELYKICASMMAGFRNVGFERISGHADQCLLIGRRFGFRVQARCSARGDTSPTGN